MTPLKLKLIKGNYMSVSSALFVPTSVVEKKDYWIGAAILIALGAAISALPLLFMKQDSGLAGIMMGSMASLLLMVLIYPWFCLIGGRLRDVGASPWFYLLGLLGYYIATTIISLIIMMPEMTGMMEDMVTNMPDPEADPQDSLNQMMDVQTEMMRKMIPKQIIATIVSSGLVALIFGLLKQKLDGNPYRLNTTVFE